MGSGNRLIHLYHVFAISHAWLVPSRAYLAGVLRLWSRGRPYGTARQGSAIGVRPPFAT